MVATHVPLSKDLRIPTVGFGTSRLAGHVREPLLAALGAGYRHIDTAKMYRTEMEIGATLKEASIPRGEVFLTTKLHQDEQGYDAALAGIDESLTHLQSDYVDLYLIHWPSRVSAAVRADTWRGMEEVLRSGKARAIGVSNYDVALLEEMRTYAEVMPCMNQIEFHPFFIPHDTKRYCDTHNILITSYSPLTRSTHLDDRVIDEIATRYGRTPAQVLLRWNLQWGNVVIPRSAHPAHIRENIAVYDFELSTEDMEALNALDRQESALR